MKKGSCGREEETNPHFGRTPASLMAKADGAMLLGQAKQIGLALRPVLGMHLEPPRAFLMVK